MTHRPPPLAAPHAMPFSGQDIRTLIDLQAQVRGDKPFLIWEPFEGEGETWAFARFADRVRRFAAALAARGVGLGDRVLVHLDNCPEAAIAWIGCAYAGAVAVTTNAKSSPDELSYFADHSGAVAAITQPKFASLVNGAARFKWLAVTETDNGDAARAGQPDAASSFERLDADPGTLPPRPHDPLADYSIQYTSGTTSRPKAVLWSHANALWGARINAVHETLTPHDVHLTTLPLFHTNAQAYSVLAALWAGCACILQPRFSASRFWPISLKHRATWASIVPFCLRALMEHEVPRDHSYRLWGNGACDMPTDAHFRVKTMGWWGMTETITHGTVGQAHLPDLPMSMGRPAPEYELRVTRDDGRPAELGETGDLAIKGVRGLSLFAEYAGNAQATADAYDEHGFFLTGDRVTIGPAGYLIFADRSKDMLKVGGENVAASEVERVVATVPGVQEVAVVAKKHRMLDEVPVVFVIPLPGAPDGLSDAIMTACTAQLATFKRPHEIRVVDAFPRSTLEKVAKAELRRMLEET
ncbi:Crotonobetaine/carnitine--CoA ligase [Alphaproteobacteria bacterium SO-S41]|nr:Crotonobetaine/carnitine--CoA ligase [Alphaproteobacteria bacterium SO-S41]